MKKPVFTLIVLLIIASLNVLQAQSLNEILEKHFKTIGQEKLTKVKTYVVKANINQMGMDLPMEMKMKRPNKFRMEMDMQGQKMIQAYNGKTGWFVAPWVRPEPQDLSGDQLQQALDQADIDGDLYKYAEKGSKAELVGKENMSGINTYHIKLTNKAGNVKNYFIDAEKYLIVAVKAKANAMGQEVEVLQKLSEYKEVNGVKLATKIESETPMGTATISFQDVVFDQDIDDGIFEKPSK